MRLIYCSLQISSYLLKVKRYSLDQLREVKKILGGRGGDVMTIDWLFIGYVAGFVTAGWVLPAIGKQINKKRGRK